MSYIDLKKFVDINIKYHKVSSTTSTRDTVVLFTTATTSALPAFEDNRDEKYAPNYDVFASVAEWMEYVAKAEISVASGIVKTIDTHLRVFFANGGTKVRIIRVDSSATAETINAAINALPLEQIVIAHTTAGALIPVAALRDGQEVSGIDCKILVDRVENFTTTTTYSHLGVKYSLIEGCQMTIAAYLSKINVAGLDTVADYAFTIEYDYVDASGTIVHLAEESSDTVFDNCTAHNYNVIMNLAGYDRNLVGNTADGNDLVNEYVLIILHQTLTSRLVNLLSQKIKGSSGISKIYAVIDDEMKKYLSNGYLTTDEIWTDADYTVSYGGQTYTIISKGDALVSGYKATILPYSSLTQEDKVARKTPPIYIILADSYGIRKIEIKGDII